MRRKLIGTVVVAATLTFVACAEEESEAVSDTSATSAGLLSGMPRSAVTPMGNDNLPPTPTQEWDFLALGFNSGSSEAPVRVVERVAQLQAEAAGTRDRELQVRVVDGVLHRALRGGAAEARRRLRIRQPRQPIGGVEPHKGVDSGSHAVVFPAQGQRSRRGYQRRRLRAARRR